MSQVVVLAPLLVLVAAQDMLTGLFGAPSIVATMIASQAMAPRRAILLSTFAQLIGPCLFGVAVATSVGSDIVELVSITPAVLYAALISTVLWMLIAWYFRIPCSSTHALIGGLVGAVLMAAGPLAIRGEGLLKILLSLTLTAPLGMLGGFLIARVCAFVTRKPTHRTDHHFNRGQLVTSLFLGMAVGSNNAQNAMGVTVLSLVATGFLTRFEVPVWVIVGSGVCLALGNLLGGMRLIHSMGTNFYPVRPLHGFSAEVSSTAIIVASSLFGGDVSTTHVTSMSIIGAGAAERFSLVRWTFVQRVLLTWIVTIPATAAGAALALLILQRLNIG